MKHIILVLLFIASFSFLNAQNFDGGLVIGYNISQIDGDAFAGYHKAGASLGGFVSYRLNRTLVLQPEILWDQLGSAGKNVAFSNRFNYISVPLLLKFAIPIQIGPKEHDLQLHLGPVVGVMINARDLITKVDISDNYRGYDVRGVAGATFDVSRRMALCLRYGYSLAPFAKGTIIGIARGPFHNYIHFSFRWYLSQG